MNVVRSVACGFGLPIGGVGPLRSEIERRAQVGGSHARRRKLQDPDRRELYF